MYLYTVSLPRDISSKETHEYEDPLSLSVYNGFFNEL